MGDAEKHKYWRELELRQLYEQNDGVKEGDQKLISFFFLGGGGLLCINNTNNNNRFKKSEYAIKK